jgi:F-type H+-transporting ATPase subunit b
MRIDWWTLGLQTVNVLVLVWLLARFLFRPVAAAIAERQAAARRVLSEAEAARTQAQAAESEAKRRLAGIAGDAERLRHEAAVAAEAVGKVEHEQAAADVARLREAAAAAIARERDTAWRELETKAGDLAVAIAQRLLGRLSPETVTTAQLAALEQRLAALPETERGLLGGESELDVISANALGERERDLMRAALTRLAGREIAVRFRADPALLAGVEIVGAQLRIRENWRADLDRIARDLRAEANDVDRARRVA